jgi:8-hydroxy-5-deazaflavin:NADPH oxidoreductase
MRIGILGAGHVGGALGAALTAIGHEVVFGVRDPDSAKTREALGAAPGVRAAAPADAIADAEVIVVALRWAAVPDIVSGLPSLDGRIVIDAMNRFDGDPARSTTQDLADLLPGARLAKAFNTIGFENLTTARDRRTKAAMFVAGDDPDAKAVAMQLAEQLGFQPEDAGGLANTKPLEELVKVWLAVARRHGRTVGFALSDG